MVSLQALRRLIGELSRKCETAPSICVALDAQVLTRRADILAMAKSNERGNGEALAVGIVRVNGEFLAAFDHPDNAVRPLGELGAKGLPKGTHQLRHTADLSKWQQADPATYAAGLGAHVDNFRQLVWAVPAGRLMALVPALALMRALFRPHTYVLSEMFRPQALDSISVVVDRIPRPRKPWPRARSSATSVAFTGLMSWLHSYPSARRCASSVYEYAKDGWLGLDLPEAELSLVLHGVQEGSSLYVTQVTATNVTAMEPPFDFAAGAPSCFQILPTNEAGRPKNLMMGANLNHLLPLRGAEATVSDDEWSKLAGILESRRARRHSTREILDELLTYTCRGVPLAAWRDEPNRRRTVLRQLETWKRNGTWAEVAKVLCASRGELRPFVPAIRNRWESGRPCNLHLSGFHPLTAEEWRIIEDVAQPPSPTKGAKAHKEVFDAILRALGSDNGWGIKVGTYSIANAAQHRYRRLVKNGRWADVVAALEMLRPI